MKEISLQDLLNMADREAHDGICDLWNQKTIHYLVVFTSPDQDFEIIGAGPTLPCATLEDAGKHQVPGKTPELYVKCPAALAGKLQPKLAPKHMGGPTRPSLTPSVKAKTSVPFPKPTLKLEPKTEAPAPAQTQPAPPPPPAPPPAIVPPPPPPPAPKLEAPKIKLEPKPATPTDLDARLAAIAQREKELTALAAALKAREAAVKQREDAATAREEKLLTPPGQTP